MKWAIALSLVFLILFGPWFVFLAERKQIRWLKPLSYFSLFLGPTLVALGIINHLKRGEGVVVNFQTDFPQKSQTQKPPP